MRRGNPRSRGNRQMHHPQHQSRQPANSGPIMTGHLQGLKDIDMELELLKRKREIIEQQQEMLSNNYRPRNDYELERQVEFEQPRQSRYDDFTRLYDNPHESGPYGGGASRKRAHVAVWESEEPPKRYSAPSRGVRKAFGSRLGPPPNPRLDFHRPNIRPAAPKPIKPRSAQFVPPQKKKEFHPTKVTKPAVGPPVKLGNYPQADRKKLVAETLAHTEATVRAPSTADANLDGWILRSDRLPTRQMNGRLELALGSIIKDLKSAHPESEDLFKQQLPLRTMKQFVRDRIRTVMIGKLVNSTDLIKATYHKTFPNTHDEDVIMKGYQASQKDSDFFDIKSDDPELYFKKNIFRLMAMKLDEMTNKLEEIYCAHPGSTLKKKQIPNTVKQKPQGVQSKEGAGESKDDGQPKEPQSNVDDGGPKTDEEAKTDAEPGIADLKPNEVAAVDTAEPNETANSDPSKDQPTPAGVRDPAADVYYSIITTDKYKAFDSLMTFKMVHLLKKFSPNILKIMDVDAMYRKTKMSIINETKKKLGGKDQTPQPLNPPKKLTTEKKFLTPLQYFVKILGKPSLPKRKAMESFFEQHEPKSIKKHRNIHNLLFVGFADKEAFEKMLAANGTVIGRFTLDIKVSERNYDKTKPGDDSQLSAGTTVKQGEEPIISDSFGSDLDEQINDLLTSIRKTEEENFSDDIVMEEPVVQTSKLEETADMEPTPVCDLTQDNLNDVSDKNENAADDDEDVIEIKDIPQNYDVIEITDVAAEDGPDDAEAEVNAEEEENKDVVNAAAEVNTEEEKNDVANTAAEVNAEEENKDVVNAEEEEKNDVVEALKTEVKDVKGTPTRASARLAAPGGIRTRRMSKLIE